LTKTTRNEKGKKDQEEITMQKILRTAFKPQKNKEKTKPKKSEKPGFLKWIAALYFAAISTAVIGGFCYTLSAKKAKTPQKPEKDIIQYSFKKDKDISKTIGYMTKGYIANGYQNYSQKTKTNYVDAKKLEAKVEK